MVLKDYEKQGVFALVARVAEASNLHKAATEVAQHAAERQRQASEAIRNGRLALTLFGFADGNEIWDEVKTALGDELYAAAINRAGRFTVPLIQPIVEEGRQIEHNSPHSTVVVDTEELSIEQESGDGNIKDRVLQLLAQAGEAGAEAGEIRAALRAEGIAMHDKTVGMSLWRLSKDGLSKRIGRRWYFVFGNSPAGGGDEPDTSAEELSD